MAVPQTLEKLIRNLIGEPSTGAEIGVWKGETSAYLLESFSELQMALIDPWKEWDESSSYAKRHQRTGRLVDSEWSSVYDECLSRLGTYLPRLRVYQMESEQAAKLQWRPFDFVFIDANHTYESVKQDISLWMPLTTKLICGHDYGGTYRGVKKAVLEFFDEKDVIAPGDRIWAVLLQSEPGLFRSSSEISD